MLVSTWNVNNVRNRLPLLLAWLEARKPDVVALQELKSTNEQFPREALEEAGYGSLVVGQKTWNGVALLARGVDPVPVRTTLPGDPKDTQARYVEAAVNGVLVASLYLPNGNPYPGPKFDYKLAWFERFIHHAESLLRSGHPVALLGDYNVVPTDADIYPSKSWENDALLQAEPRAAFARLLKQGWVDAVRKTYPTQNIYTFWDYKRQRWERNAGLRIDHILLSKSLGKKLTSAGVDRELRGMEKPSDHAPVWADLG